MTNDAQKRFTILRRKQVQERTGLSRSTIYLRIAQEPSPKQSHSEPVPSVGWDSEIDDWLNSRIELSRG